LVFIATNILLKRATAVLALTMMKRSNGLNP
jgi:hypothetical protein